MAAAEFRVVAPEATVSINGDGQIVFWSGGAERLFGWPAVEVLGRDMAEVVIPERLREAHRTAFARLRASGRGSVLDQRLVVPARHRDGHEFAAELTVSAWREQGTWRAHAVIRAAEEPDRPGTAAAHLASASLGEPEAPHASFRAIVEELSLAITIRDVNDRLLWANRAALRLLGFSSLEALRAVDLHQIMADYTVTREDGSPVRMEDIPSVQLLNARPADALVIRNLHRESGTERWLRLTASPLTGEDGRIEATVMVIEDMTERKRSELRNAFLATATAALTASLDYEETLRRLADLAVPKIADWCAVDLLDETGRRRTLALAHRDPGRLALAQELRRYTDGRPQRTTAVGRAIYERQMTLIRDITPEMLAGAAEDDRHLELLTSIGFRSVLVVPLATAARVLGAITLVNSDSSRNFDDEDVRLSEALAGRAAQGIENARLYRERSEIAETLQDSLKPEPLPELAGWRLDSLYHAAGQLAEVGGDFLDVWHAEGRAYLLLGDVTGRGIRAAALTARLRHTIRAAAHYVEAPADLLARANAALCALPELSLASAICARIDGSTLTLASAGHPPPLRRCAAGGSIETVDVRGSLLGLDDTTTWEETRIELVPGDVLLFHTDGVTDLRAVSGERLGEGPVRAALRAQPTSATAVMARLEAALLGAAAGRLSDDVAAIAIERLDQHSPATGSP